MNHNLKNNRWKKNTIIKGRGADYTDEEKTNIAKGTVRNEFRKRTGMSFQEFFANVKADSAAARRSFRERKNFRSLSFCSVN